MVEANRVTITEEELIKIYGQHEVVPSEGAAPISISQMVALEALLCAADSDKRADPEVRVKYLASRIGRGSLREEHRYLLDNQE